MKSVLHVFAWPELEAELEAELESEHEVAERIAAEVCRFLRVCIYIAKPQPLCNLGHHV